MEIQDDKFGIMNESPAAADWAAARGEKRRAQLAGMEAMLTPVDEPLIRALLSTSPEGSPISDAAAGRPVSGAWFGIALSLAQLGSTDFDEQSSGTSLDRTPRLQSP